MANKKAKGKRAKSRHKLRRKTSKMTVNKMLQGFDLNQRVIIKINPAFHSGMPFRRFHGKAGVVLGRQGNAFKVQVCDGKMVKDLLVHPAHLELFKI